MADCRKGEKSDAVLSDITKGRVRLDQAKYRQKPSLYHTVALRREFNGVEGEAEEARGWGEVLGERSLFSNKHQRLTLSL
jgi:hypothetical protein